MTQPIDYNGYEIIATHNKKIVARIKNNLHASDEPTLIQKPLMYEPPIRFVFRNYDTMINFIDANKR